MDPAKLREALRKQGIHGHESDPVLEVAAICELAVADTVKAIEGLNKESIRMSGVPGASSAVVSSGQTAARCAARPARPRHPDALVFICQSASKIDPRSALKTDPPGRACAGSP